MRAAFPRLLTVALASVLSVAAANATTISGTYSVTGSGFVSSGIPPFATITESFSITFNNTVPASQQTTGILLNTSTITPASPLAYTYIPATDTLIVGGAASTVTTSDPNSTDFALTISNASSVSNFQVTALSYSVGSGQTYTATTAGRTPTATPAPTPEPSTLALLGTGLLGVVGAARRRWRS